MTRRYSRLNLAHWVLAIFSNSRKIDYTPPDVAARYPGKTQATQRILYWWRNNGHDLTAFMLGFEEDPAFQTVAGNAVDTLRPGWIFALRQWHRLRLPYVAYQRQFTGWVFQFYIGWRPTGALGF